MASRMFVASSAPAVTVGAGDVDGVEAGVGAAAVLGGSRAAAGDGAGAGFGASSSVFAFRRDNGTLVARKLALGFKRGSGREVVVESGVEVVAAGIGAAAAALDEGSGSSTSSRRKCGGSKIFSGFVSFSVFRLSAAVLVRVVSIMPMFLPWPSSLSRSP